MRIRILTIAAVGITASAFALNHVGTFKFTPQTTGDDLAIALGNHGLDPSMAPLAAQAVELAIQNSNALGVRLSNLEAGVTPPRAIQEVRPTYTPEALRQKITGSVFIQGIVGVDGVFHNLQIVRSLDAVYGLDDAALKAASQWRFIPGLKDGQPVPVVTTIELTFTVR